MRSTKEINLHIKELGNLEKNKIKLEMRWKDHMYNKK